MKFRTALAMLTLMPALAFAQPPGGERGGPGGPGHRGPPPLSMIVDRHGDEIGITAEVQDEIEALYEATRPEVEALQEELKGLRDGMRELMQQHTPNTKDVSKQLERMSAAELEMRQLHIATDLEARALLTAEQWSKLQELRPERGERPGRGDGPRGDGPRRRGL